MKMTINKLIANDIINYGMNQTSGFDYSVYLNSYIDDYDEESKKYILDNLDNICNDIRSNENISYFNYNKDREEFDMVFYWDNLLSEMEKFVCDIIKDKDKDKDASFELDDIRDIAHSIMEDEQIKNLTIEKIRNAKIEDLNI